MNHGVLGWIFRNFASNSHDPHPTALCLLPGDTWKVHGKLSVFRWSWPIDKLHFPSCAAPSVMTMLVSAFFLVHCPMLSINDHNHHHDCVGQLQEVASHRSEAGF